MSLLHVKANKEDVVSLVGRGAGEAGAQVGHGTGAAQAHQQVGIGQQDDGALLVQVGQDVVDGGDALLHHHPVILGRTESLQHPLGILRVRS